MDAAEAECCVASRSQGPAGHSKAAASAWGCPKCRVEYPVAEAPRQYMCMCGAVADPAFDPWLLPHTCGATCGHELQPACGHSCLLLCHPGPCPPCPRQVLPCPGNAWPNALADAVVSLYMRQDSPLPVAATRPLVLSQS